MYLHKNPIEVLRWPFFLQSVDNKWVPLQEQLKSKFLIDAPSHDINIELFIHSIQRNH